MLNVKYESIHYLGNNYVRTLDYDEFSEILYIKSSIIKSFYQNFCDSFFDEDRRV